MAFGTSSDAIARASARADRRIDAAIGDLLLAEHGRLDERTRTLLRRDLGALVAGIEGDVRRHAARLLAARTREDAAARLIEGDGAAWTLLVAQRLLDDRALLTEAIAATRLVLLSEGLPANVGEGARASLIVRLADLPDRAVAQAARAVMAADGDPALMLTAEPHARLVWQVAAAVRLDTLPEASVDLALAEAARRAILAHDEGKRPIAIAERLVAAIDPLPQEVAALAADAILDRRPALCAAVLARALAIDIDTAILLLIEPDDARLPVAMRALGMTRDQIARTALALSDADPARDIEAFADALDAIDALDRPAAAALIAPLALPRGFRDAVATLERRR